MHIYIDALYHGVWASEQDSLYSELGERVELEGVSGTLGGALDNAPAWESG